MVKFSTVAMFFALVLLLAGVLGGILFPVSLPTEQEDDWEES
jgi:hypothetical protein